MRGWREIRQNALLLINPESTESHENDGSGVSLRLFICGSLYVLETGRIDLCIIHYLTLWFVKNAK